MGQKNLTLLTGDRINEGFICTRKCMAVLLCGQKEVGGVPLYCGNHYYFALELWCGYFLLSFQSFVLRHLVIVPAHKTNKLS